jgi:hypothetical protein
LKGNSILSVGVRAGDSYIWGGIIKAKDVLKDGISVRLGQGLSSLWFTDWLGTGKLCDRVPYVHVADSDLLVSNVWTNNEWNLSSLYTSIPEVVINEIRAITIPLESSGNDYISWTHNLDGTYSASSGYD